jgi:hypothetical protein
MTPITIIMMIFERFFYSSVSSEELERMRGDANNWWSKIDVNKEEEVLPQVKLWCTNWYAKMLLAASYFFIVKWLMDFLTDFQETVSEGYQNKNL